MSTARTLRVKCSSWDQVESFYLRKLRRGRSVTIRVPFTANAGDPIAVGLELPNALVVVIDGAITGATPMGDDRTSIDIDLHGLSADVVDRLETLVADGRNVDTPREVLDFVADGLEQVHSGPYGTDAARELADPAHGVVVTLDAELRRMRQLAVHEVLGVPWDAGPLDVRAAWRRLCLRLHPDVLAPHGSAAVIHLAEELMILVNRAYERLRAALVTEGRAAAFGPALRPEKGWLVAFDAVKTGEIKPPVTAPPPPPIPAPNLEALRRKRPTSIPTVKFGQTTESVFDDLAPKPVTVETSIAAARASAIDNPFEQQARARLAAGDHLAAREVLAAALYAYPRNAHLRALYHVASAMEAFDAGQAERAVSQLEAALTVDAGCREAQLALEELRKRRHDPAALGGIFK